MQGLEADWRSSNSRLKVCVRSIRGGGACRWIHVASGESQILCLKAASDQLLIQVTFLFWGFGGYQKWWRLWASGYTDGGLRSHGLQVSISEYGPDNTPSIIGNRQLSKGSLRGQERSQ